MTTHHEGARHACEGRDLNSYVADARNKEDNASTDSSETITAFRGSEADGCLSDHLPNN